MKQQMAFLKKQLNAAMQSTGTLGSAYPTTMGDWAKYAQLANVTTATSTEPIRKRLERRLKDAEKELIRLNKLQDLINTLPADMTDDDLRSLINV